jgi:carboxyl-terminal processing protease
MTRRAFRVALLLMVWGAATPARAAGQSDGAGIPRRTTYEDLQLFGQVLNQIRVNHPDSIEAHELFLAAVEAMVHAADPHSYVVPAMRLDAAKAEALEKGKLYPLPIDFSFVGGTPVVVSVAAGTAARRLDILPGDELVSVDGAAFLAHSAAELDVELAGPKKTPVRLTIERRRDDGSFVRLDRVVQRERAEEESAVPVSMMLDSATGYVRVTTFVGERVADDLHGALERLEKGGMQQLLLDLRDNGGGSVAEAAHVAGEFLPRGAIVYTSEGRKPEITDTGRVKRSFFRSERRYPIVVMVNAGTASASELVAGALQDHDRALIVGRPTFGKSLLMRGFPMSDGSVLWLVVGHVRTPCGRVVQRQYRSITRREYYRLARAERDTAGRPACRTDAGRTVYGGGGIFPDVTLPDAPSQPRWASRLDEQQLLMTWSGSYVDAHGATLTDVDAFSARELPAAALADFRAYASKQGVSIPADGDGLLREMLLTSIAYARWGTEGAYRVYARRDGEVRAAMAGFGAARVMVR